MTGQEYGDLLMQVTA